MDIIKTYCFRASFQVEQGKPRGWGELFRRKREECNLEILAGQDTALAHWRVALAGFGGFVLSAGGVAGSLGG
jgi:hypothetical protein